MKYISNGALRDIIAVLRAFMDEPTVGSNKYRNALRRAHMLHGKLCKIDNGHRPLMGILTIFRKKSL